MKNIKFDPEKHLLQKEQTEAEENKVAINGKKNQQIFEDFNLSQDENEENRTEIEEGNAVAETGNIAISDKTGTTVEVDIPVEKDPPVKVFGEAGTKLSIEEKKDLIKRACELSLEISLDKFQKEELNDILEKLGYLNVNEVWEKERNNIPNSLVIKRHNCSEFSEYSIGDRKKSVLDYITAFFSPVWFVISFFFSRNGRKYLIPALILGLVALIYFIVLPNYPKWFEGDETKGDVLKQESPSTTSLTISSITSITTVHESFQFVSASIFVERNNDGVPMAYVAIDVLKDKKFVPVEFSVPDSVITRERDQKKGYQWVYIRSEFIKGKKIIKEVFFHLDEFWRINRMVAR